MQASNATDRVPRLPGYIRNHRVAVWCDHCAVYHWHGLPWPGDTTHRQAHCHDAASPYHLSGYHFGLLIEMPDEVWVDAHRRQPRGPLALAQAGSDIPGG